MFVFVFFFSLILCRTNVQSTSGFDSLNNGRDVGCDERNFAIQGLTCTDEGF